MHFSLLRNGATGRFVGRVSGCSLLLASLVVAPVACADDASFPPLLDKPLPVSSVDSVGEQPTPGHVFISGHWSWSDGAYSWDEGHWELPPSASAVWIAPKWEKRDRGYMLVPGCWREGAPQGHSADVLEEPAAEPSAVVDDAPPPPEQEEIAERPSPDHVWLGGYWSWRDGKHTWVSGRWDLPPRPDVVWVAPCWVRRGHGYVLVEGRWRDSRYRSRTTVVVESDGWRSDGVVTIAPPPPRRVVHTHRPARPSYEHVWTNGYWAWYGDRYVWINGCWRRPPVGRFHWVEPRWERRKGGYIFIEGAWR